VRTSARRGYGAAFVAPAACGVERHQNDKHRRQHEQEHSGGSPPPGLGAALRGGPLSESMGAGAFAGIGWRHRNVLLGLTRSPALVSGFLSLAS
jgi:hypothetical protein